MIVLRTLEVDDWADWRKLRLAALRDAPDAFGSRLADWQGEGDDEPRWRRRLDGGSHNLLAYLDGKPAGMVSSTPPDREGTVELISMWVAPFGRGRGVGDALVTAVIRWADDRGAGRVALEVAEGNVEAAALYRRHGFLDSGLVDDPARNHLVKRKMVRELAIGKSPEPGMVSWAARREGELDPGQHGRIAATLRAAFPAYVNAFPGRRSWSGARPELRVIGSDHAGVAAHAGVLRRFIQVVDGDRVTEQLVAVVGLVAVRPDLHGSGIGKQLGSHVADSLHDLAVPFGLLGCRDEVAGYYQSVGWHPLPPTRSVYCPMDIHDPARVVEDSEGWMVLPVAEPLARWPPGDLLWNGSPV